MKDFCVKGGAVQEKMGMDDKDWRKIIQVLLCLSYVLEFF